MATLPLASRGPLNYHSLSIIRRLDKPGPSVSLVI